MEWLQNFREDETGGRDRERYDDERVGGWMVSASIFSLLHLKLFIQK